MPVQVLPRVPEGLTPGEVAALRAIYAAPLAISDRTGLAWCGPDLDRLISAGYVAEWIPPRTAARYVTLTPYGAEALGVDLDEIGPEERPVWQPDLSEIEPNRKRPVRLPSQSVRRRLPRPDLLPSPSGELVFAWSVPRPPKEIMDRIRLRARQRRRSKKSQRKAVRKPSVC